MAKDKKVKRFVIDVNSFVTIFINRETEWLLAYVLKNKLEIFIDDQLIEELSHVLEYSKIKLLLPLRKHIYIDFVRLISTHIEPSSFNTLSPDPKDNYLYDLALSSNAKLIVSGEKALLNWSETPVKTINLSSFKNLF